MILGILGPLVAMGPCGVGIKVFNSNRTGEFAHGNVKLTDIGLQPYLINVKWCCWCMNRLKGKQTCKKHQETVNWPTISSVQELAARLCSTAIAICYRSMPTWLSSLVTSKIWSRFSGNRTKWDTPRISWSIIIWLVVWNHGILWLSRYWE